MPEIDRWENEGGMVHRPKASARLQSLQRRHSQLDIRVDAELKRPKPCSLELQRLKREKLYLKDEMTQLAA